MGDADEKDICTVVQNRKTHTCLATFWLYHFCMFVRSANNRNVLSISSMFRHRLPRSRNIQAPNTRRVLAPAASDAGRPGGSLEPRPTPVPHSRSAARAGVAAVPPAFSAAGLRAPLVGPAVVRSAGCPGRHARRRRRDLARRLRRGAHQRCRSCPWGGVRR